MILVTGATGFIGSHLAELLVSRGERVRALTRKASSARHLPPLEVACADFTTANGLDQALEGVQTVIHLAGATKALHPEDYYTANVKATETLARAVAGCGIRLVHVSSLAVMGPNPPATPAMEDSEPHPLTHYGKSKLAAEEAVRALLPDAVIVRPPVVYGPRDTAVLQMLKPICRGWALEIAGGDRWFSAIYVRDLVEGLIRAARAPQAAGRTYFLAHPVPVSWRDLAAAASGIVGRRTRVVRVPVKAAEAIALCGEIWARLTGSPGILSREKVAEARCAAWTCDTRRAAAELGFQAGTPFEKGLAETLAWYKGAGWLRY